MKETKWKDGSREHWVGLDVSKRTFDAATDATLESLSSDARRSRGVPGLAR